MKTPTVIKRKMHRRKKLIARLRLNPDASLKQRLKNMNVEIKNPFYEKKKKIARRNIIPGNEPQLFQTIMQISIFDMTIH